MNHPASCKDPGCTLTYREHLLNISISAAATPTRRPHAARALSMDAKFDKDATAYRAMRKQGIQPPHVDGSHELAQRSRKDADIKPLGERLFQRHQRETA